MNNVEATRIGIENAFGMAGYMIVQAAQAIEYAHTKPSTIYRPALSIDGDQWCALYGENLQDGVAGFGASPEEAMNAFDKAWYHKLPTAVRP